MVRAASVRRRCLIGTRDPRRRPFPVDECVRANSLDGLRVAGGWGRDRIPLFAPNLIWNIHHQFPFLELQANIRASGRDVSLGPAAFFAQETLAMQPVALPVWVAGLWFFFATERGRTFRS